MNSYQFCFDADTTDFVITRGDGEWAQIDMGPSVSMHILDAMLHDLVRRFPPADTVVLNFPVWVNTPEARSAVTWIVHKFAADHQVDISVFFPFATAADMWEFARALPDGVCAFEAACGEECDEVVDDVWAARPQIEEIRIITEACGGGQGPLRIFRRDMP